MRKKPKRQCHSWWWFRKNRYLFACRQVAWLRYSFWMWVDFRCVATADSWLAMNYPTAQDKLQNPCTSKDAFNAALVVLKFSREAWSMALVEAYSHGASFHVCKLKDDPGSFWNFVSRLLEFRGGYRSPCEAFWRENQALVTSEFRNCK